MRGKRNLVLDFFDREYARFERYWWREANRYSQDPRMFSGSTRSVLEHLRGRVPGRALDLGAGEGADAIRLALMGYEVDAVEGSEIGVRKIQYFADEVGANLRVHHMDVRRFDSALKYDVVLCHGMLHYVGEQSDVLDLIDYCTRPGGVASVSVFSNYTPLPQCHRFAPVYCDDEDGIVAAHFRQWDQLQLTIDRNRPERHHPGMPSHEHSFVKAVAVRPIRFTTVDT